MDTVRKNYQFATSSAQSVPKDLASSVSPNHPIRANTLAMFMLSVFSLLVEEAVPLSLLLRASSSWTAEEAVVVGHQ